MLSHELRNPLGAITMAAQLLEPVVSPTSERSVPASVLIRQSTHLARIVDDLLDVARRDRRPGHPRPHSSQPGRRRQASPRRAAGRRRARSSPIALRLEPATVEVDTARMEQVVTNLLVNAVKYTDRRRPHRGGGAGQDDEAVVCVRDTGVGMSPGDAATPLPAFRPGAASAGSCPGWSRHRPHACAAADRAARRPGRGLEPRARPRQHFHRAPHRVARASLTACENAAPPPPGEGAVCASSSWRTTPTRVKCCGRFSTGRPRDRTRRPTV